MNFPFFGAKNKDGGGLLAAYLKEIMKNAILLERDEEAAEPPVGTSKIGGVPHLPADFQWPYYEAESYDGEVENQPLSFIAQIDLAAAAPFDRDSLLPGRGYLYFFYETVSQKWGFDPKDAGCARVYYFDVTADRLVQTPLPEALPEEARVPLSVLSLRTMDELPGYEEFCELTDVKRFGPDFCWGSYEQAAESHIQYTDCNPDEVCKLLGYADLVQGSMLGECAQVTAGLYCGDGKAYQNASQAQKAALAADARNWTLLAQFGTLSDEIMFGDCGCIYFYIRKQDLAARRFDRVWLCLQCG